MSATKLIAERAISVRAMVENVPSPCVSVCRMDAKREFCEGCWRSIDEIRRWSASSDAEKQAVWALIGQRASASTVL